MARRGGGGESLMVRRLTFWHLSVVWAVLVTLLLSFARPVAAEYVAIDLHPSGFTNSIAFGVSSGQQVGRGFIGGVPHALLWTGSPASVVDLHPSGFIASEADGVSNGQQVGVGSVHGPFNARRF